MASSTRHSARAPSTGRPPGKDAPRPKSKEKKIAGKAGKKDKKPAGKKAKKPPPQRVAPAWSVYILRCADTTLYTGCTNDLVRRLKRHLGGEVKYTRGRLPVEVIYHESADGHGAALSREAAIKKMSRAAKLALLGTPGMGVAGKLC